jgi:secreted PhoX family phosphatase
MRRRQAVLGSAAAVAGFVLGCRPRGPAPAAARLGFAPVPTSRADVVVVPSGYRADVIFPWGEPLGQGPDWDPGARNTAEDQEQQAGMQHDGMHFFPLPAGSASSEHGLLVMNHESVDDGLLHADGTATWSLEKVRKAQAAVGVSVIEVRLVGGRFVVQRSSPFARRIHARTPLALSGPAAGHPLLQTKADPTGRRVLGTFSNCASGQTPWGTYLTCEENVTDHFGSSTGVVLPDHTRYRILPAGVTGYGWHDHDPRFDVAREPNEPNRCGWVVEIDPYDPASTPVKRTALGRFKHENAAVTLARDGRVVVYSGDDQVFERIYKFVSRFPWVAGGPRDVLDHGTLHVARFDEDGRGRWIALEQGRNGLTAEAGFPDQAHVLVRTRQAADLVGATPMDRPEWIAVHPDTGDVCCSLTNNALRGRPGYPGPDAANPAAPNELGHVVRWRETGGDAAAEDFTWDILVRGRADDDGEGDGFGCPDGLAFDGRGLLWIQTDAPTSGRAPYATLGNNMMLAADPVSGEVRRFLTGPRGCEIAGLAFTPDGRTLFINVMHPGKGDSRNSDPLRPTAISTWPDGDPAGRPRSATLVIRRTDGGVIGT